MQPAAAHIVTIAWYASSAFLLFGLKHRKRIALKARFCQQGLHWLHSKLARMLAADSDQACWVTPGAQSERINIYCVNLLITFIALIC